MGLDIGEFIDQRIGSAISAGEIPEILESVQQQILINSAIIGTTAEATGAVETGGAIAGIFAAIGLLPIILILIAVIIVLGFLHHALATALRRIPWVGTPLGNFMDLVFTPVGNLETWVVGKAEALVNTLWHDLTSVIGYFAGLHTIRTAGTSHIPSSAQVQTLQAEITNTNARVDDLNTRLIQLSYYVHHEPSATLPQGVLTLPEQLYKVQQDVQVLYNNQVHFHQELQTVVAEMTRIVHDLQQVEATLVGTRAIEIGLQDIIKNVDSVITQTRQLEAELAPKVAANTRSIAVLQPLNLLLEPGIAGLKNLRKLEDDPCQCPKLGNIGNELGTALALLEFVENG